MFEIIFIFYIYLFVVVDINQQVVFSHLSPMFVSSPQRQTSFCVSHFRFLSPVVRRIYRWLVHVAYFCVDARKNIVFIRVGVDRSTSDREKTAALECHFSRSCTNQPIITYYIRHSYILVHWLVKSASCDQK